MALINAYLYLLFIDLANFHIWELDDTTTTQACLASWVTFVITYDANGSTIGHTSAIRHDWPVIGPVRACINFGCMIAVEP